jgi:hypothetical protein
MDAAASTQANGSSPLVGRDAAPAQMTPQFIERDDPDARFRQIRVGSLIYKILFDGRGHLLSINKNSHLALGCRIWPSPAFWVAKAMANPGRDDLTRMRRGWILPPALSAHKKINHEWVNAMPHPTVLFGNEIECRCRAASMRAKPREVRKS